ncbi:hypothetical protein ABWH98_00150 [Labrenzia sp. ac12]
MKLFDLGVSINDEKMKKFSSGKKKVYLISGASRGGTSALAYALRRANIYFGDVDVNNHELPDLMIPDLTNDKIKAAIDGLLVEEDVVGIKLPNFSFHLTYLTSQYPNSILLYVIRNPLDVASTIMSRSPVHGLNKSDLQMGIQHAFHFYFAMAKVLDQIEQPVYLLSFERMKAQSERFATWLEEIGINLSDENRSELAKEIAAPGYKSIAKERSK